MKIENLKLKIKDILFFAIATTVILGLNLTPLVTHLRLAPSGRTFGLIHNNVQDFYFYQALMNEGANGAWLTSDPYTSEPHQPSIIFSYFLVLGKLSKLLGLSFAITYHLIRIFLSILFLFSIFYFLFSIRIPHPRLTYLFFLFATPFMHSINDYGTLKTVPFMSWWNGIDPIRRAAFLPHHMAGGLLLVLSIILIFKYINTPARSHLARLIFISAMMAFIHTPSLLILLLILPVSLIIYSVINRLSPRISKHEARISKQYQNSNDKNSKLFRISDFGFRISQFIGLSVYWVLGILFLIVMVMQTKSGFPWSQYIDWEKGLQFPLERELIGALGILFPFSLMGIYTAIKSRKFEYIFIACWLVVPLLLIPIAPKLNLSNIRLIQGIPYLPLSILAILGIKTLTDFVIKIATKTPRGWQAGVATQAMTPPMVKDSEKSGRTRKLILVGIIAIFSIFTYPTLKWSLTDQIREFTPVYGNVYLDNRLFDAFAFIKNSFPVKTITLSTFYAGNYLPVYTDTVSFAGHFGYTYNWQEKEKKMQKFFENKMSVEEAKSFLTSNKITLVFQGPEEKYPFKDHLYPTILKPIYDKEEVTIYKPNF